MSQVLFILIHLTCKTTLFSNIVSLLFERCVSEQVEADVQETI